MPALPWHCTHPDVLNQVYVFEDICYLFICNMWNACLKAWTRRMNSGLLRLMKSHALKTDNRDTRWIMLVMMKSTLEHISMAVHSAPLPFSHLFCTVDTTMELYIPVRAATVYICMSKNRNIYSYHDIFMHSAYILICFFLPWLLPMGGGDPIINTV